MKRHAITFVELLVIIAIISISLGLLLPAVHKVRSISLSNSCVNNLKQIGLALHSYHDTYHSIPPATVTQPTPQVPYAFLNWTARITPWLDQTPVWQRTVQAFRQNSNYFVVPPHDIRQIPLKIYICPAGGREVGNPQPENTLVAFCYYLGVTIKLNKGVFYKDSVVHFSDVTDGLSNTLMVGERPPSADDRFGWWYGGIGQKMDGRSDSWQSVRERDETFRAPMCPVGPYHYRPGVESNMCSMFSFWSLHSGGANFLFADGTVHFLPYAADAIMPALASRAGGETVQLPD